MLELPQPGIAKSRTAKAGASSKRSRRGKPSRISPVISRAIVRSSQSEMLFLGRLCFRWREYVCVEQVLAVPVCYFAVLAAGKMVMRHLFILLVSWEKEECRSFVVPSYGRQFRCRIGQQRPLLLSHEVSRRHRIIRPRALAHCENFIAAAERSRVAALIRLHFVIPLGRSVRCALEA